MDAKMYVSKKKKPPPSSPKRKRYGTAYIESPTKRMIRRTGTHKIVHFASVLVTHEEFVPVSFEDRVSRGSDEYAAEHNDLTQLKKLKDYEREQKLASMATRGVVLLKVDLRAKRISKQYSALVRKRRERGERSSSSNFLKKKKMLSVL